MAFELGAISKVFFDFLKLGIRYLVAICLASAFLLFAKPTLLKQLGLIEFTNNYRPILGGIFVFSGVVIIINLFISAWQLIAKRVRVNRTRKYIQNKLLSLTEDEKQILRFYVAKQTRTNYLKIDDGVVNGLVANRIIYRAAPCGSMLNGFAHNISDTAWDYLNKNHHLLEGETNVYRTDKVNYFQ